jgi:hypothetical protein
MIICESNYFGPNIARVTISLYAHEKFNGEMFQTIEIKKKVSYN